MAYPVELAPIVLYRGDYRVLPYYFWADEAKTVPVDLSVLGTAVQCQARAKEDGELLAELQVDAQLEQGVLRLVVTPDTWAALVGVRSFGFDVQLGPPESPVTVLRGSVKVEKDFTHA